MPAPPGRTRSAPGLPARGTSHGSRHRWPASPSDWTESQLVLARASGVAPRAAPPAAPVAPGGAPYPPVARRSSGRLGQRSGLEELQSLHVQEAGWVADDVGLPQRLQELLRTLEVTHPDANRPQALGNVRVRAGAGGNAVFGREAHGFVVELGDRHARVEDLDGVDLIENREQVLVVG